MSENILQKIIQPGARGKIWRTFVLVMLLALAAGLVAGGGQYNRAASWLAERTGQTVRLPLVKETPFRLGLDLLGGTHLVYEADMSQIPDRDQGSALEGVRDVIERRVNVFGVSEPNVQTNVSGGDYRLIVEIAGISDVNEAITMIGETPLLEFKEQDTEIRELTDEERAELEEYNREAEERAEDILGKLIAGGDFTALARELSEDEATKDAGGDMGFVTENDNPQLVAFARTLEAGEYARELFRTGAGFEIIKLEDSRIKANPFDETDQEKEVKASHILICHEDSQGCESGLSREEALEKIGGLKAEATPANFDRLARENSTEPGASETGGDLGWFGRGMMVEPFEQAVLGLPVGAVSDVVETEFGYHLIYKSDERAVAEYRIRRILVRTKSEADITGPQEEWMNTQLSGKNLVRAVVQFNPNDNSPEVSLEFDGEGAKLFEDITGRNVGRPVAIFLDGYPISVPTVNEKISGGQAVISGRFDISEAKLLAQRLNAGALPVPITLISQQTIGPSLGKVSLEESLRAGFIGLILVALFMFALYRLPGGLAVFSLIIYGLIVLAIFKLWPVTLTLAGLAGFILSIGMAVDANVLIFERLKEELRFGRPLDNAIEEAIKRAWPSIRDGNISTLITCFILIQFSTSVVQGFAITLGLGIVVSMFSAIIVTKNFLQLFSGSWLERRRWLIGRIKIE